MRFRIVLCAIIMTAGALSEGTPPIAPGHVAGPRVFATSQDHCSCLKTVLPHNLVVGVDLVMGCLTLGFITVWELFLIGRSVASPILIGRKMGLGSRLIVASIAPHAPFELSAFLVAGAAAFGPAQILLSSERSTMPALKAELRRLGIYSVMSAGLLAIAAAIECWITPLVMASLSTLSH